MERISSSKIRNLFLTILLKNPKILCRLYVLKLANVCSNKPTFETLSTRLFRLNCKHTEPHENIC